VEAKEIISQISSDRLTHHGVTTTTQPSPAVD